MFEAFFEPIKAEKDDESVDEYWVRNHRDEVEDDLLIRVKQIEIDGIQTALGRRTAREEEGVDVWRNAARNDYDGAEKRHADEVEVM